MNASHSGRCVFLILHWATRDSRGPRCVRCPPAGSAGRPTVREPTHSAPSDGAQSLVAMGAAERRSDGSPMDVMEAELCMQGLGPSQASHCAMPSMTSSGRKELEAMVRAQRREVQELQREARKAARRARELPLPPRISSGIWVLLRVVQGLCRQECEADLVATHVLQHRCGKRAHPGSGAAPPPLGALGKPSVVSAAATHLDGAVQTRLAWRAAKLVAEARVVLRINDANARGSSPNIAEVAKWLVDDWPEAERRGRYPAFVAGICGGKSRKGWAMKFRKRWHIRLRIMPWRSAVSPEMQSRRVFGRVAGPITTATSGPISGATKRLQKLGLSVMAGRVGPHF